MSEEEKNNALVPLNELPISKYDDTIFQDLATSGDYLPRLQLMTSASDACKSGSFSVNHYALVEGGKHIDLGKEVDLAVLAWRPKAFDSNETVVSFDPTDKVFLDIRERSFQSNSGCMFGMEFLVFVDSKNRFATLFMGSKSARRTAIKVKDYVQKCCTLISKKIDNKKHVWFAPDVQDCDRQFPVPAEDAMAELEKFNNPTSSNVEATDTEERER